MSYFPQICQLLPQYSPSKYNANFFIDLSQKQTLQFPCINLLTFNIQSDPNKIMKAIFKYYIQNLITYTLLLPWSKLLSSSLAWSIALASKLILMLLPLSHLESTLRTAAKLISPLIRMLQWLQSKNQAPYLSSKPQNLFPTTSSFLIQLINSNA